MSHARDGASRPDDKSPAAAVLIAYALPALPLATLTLPVYIYVPTYYSETLGLPLAAVGYVLLMIRLADAVTDPVIGYLGDRASLSGRRRKTWFAASLPLTTLSLIMLLVPPENAGLGYLALWGLLLSFGWTMALIPYAAWGAELAQGYHARARVVAVREACVVAGTLIATALPAILPMMGLVGDDKTLSALAFIAAPSLILFGLWMLVRVPEPVDRSDPVRPGLRQTLAEMRANKPFLRLLSAFLLNGSANALPATLFLFFVQYRLEADDFTGPLLFAYFLSGVLAIPLWLRLAKGFGKHRTWCGAMIFACMIFACVPLLGPGDVWPFLAISIATGMALGADLVLPNAVQADVIDVDLVSSGQQRSGAYFAAWGLVTKLALALGVGIAFPVLSLTGFDPGAGIVTEIGLWTLTLFYSVVPVALKIGAIALMWGFPIDEAHHADLQRRIAGRRLETDRS